MSLGHDAAGSMVFVSLKLLTLHVIVVSNRFAPLLYMWAVLPLTSLRLSRYSELPST